MNSLRQIGDELHSIAWQEGLEVTGYDPCLAGIALDPDRASDHILLQDMGAKELEEYMDAPYSAYLAGYKGAAWIIYQAAEIQVQEHLNKEGSPDPLPLVTCQVGLDSIENPHEALALLDSSIASIEITLENFKNGLTSEDS